ncbi:hypothetical protein ACFJIY_08175 [Pimelobacter simplex]|uniref:hypothetical protein n=1 Tax=Nocardioides simplex TaxID=2045 RepID=UPI00366BC398
MREHPPGAAPGVEDGCRVRRQGRDELVEQAALERSLVAQVRDQLGVVVRDPVVERPRRRRPAGARRGAGQSAPTT